MKSCPVLMFGGKGGVGKTTCSSALAVHFAAEGARTLLLTTDQTPSLSDLFDRPLGEGATLVAPNLLAMEIGADRVVALWKDKFGGDFAELLGHFLDLEALDAESRVQLLDYIGSAPSLLEETMLDHIADLAEGGVFDRVVWDTAPAGETLALIGLPRAMRRHLSAGARFYQELDRVGRKVAGGRSIAAVMDGWVERSDRLEAFLREAASFVLVAQPEPMVVAQSRRVLSSLRGQGVTVAGVVVNRVAGQSECGSPQEVRAAQARPLAELAQMAEGLPLAYLMGSPGGVQGLRDLHEMGRSLAAGLKLG
jgi:arsenite/tail-anchored protein-transporting ATPase